LLMVSGFLIWRTPHRLIVGVGLAALNLDLMGVRNTWHLVVFLLAVRTPHGNTKRNHSAE
jgi:hypothetical protein